MSSRTGFIAGLAAIALLAACGGPPAAPVSHPPDDLEPAATQTISASAPRFEHKDDKAQADAVYTALDAEDAAVRDAALEQLTRLETRESTVRLQLLITDPDKNVREDTVDALADVDTPLAHELLLRASLDPHPAVREAALDALARRQSVAR